MTQSQEVSQSVDQRRCHPEFVNVALLFSDVISLVISACFAVLFTSILNNTGAFVPTWFLIPLIATFLASFAAAGMYSGATFTSPEEVRSSTTVLVLVFAQIRVLSLLVNQRHLTATRVLVVGVFVSLILVPSFRVLVRNILAGYRWWGCSAVLIGSAADVEKLNRMLREGEPSDFKLIAVICSENLATPYVGAPVLRPEEISGFQEYLRGSCLIMVQPTGSDSFAGPVLRQYRKLFRQIIVVPESWNLSAYVTPTSLGGTFALKVQEHSFDPTKQLIKRTLDVLLAVALALATAPILIAIAVLIVLDSKGPVFFGHKRIGRDGAEFRAWKFRSMVRNADQVLERHLGANFDAQTEWTLNHKLRNDPRNTRVGALLRKTSLDELPQLWNVLKGDMSLVGPRPIVHNEIWRYGDNFEIYKQVPSGLTGLWQVSGRSETSYDQRVYLDVYYVQNWSVWLDLCILYRTVGVVLMRKGAC